ncbi:MAG: CPBP family intramembrane metalloprotease [Bacteroidetes bacterium]|nr:MAG: CPBP family intramembrane metalloprotease [Bacteroidota bacterium]
MMLNSTFDWRKLKQLNVVQLLLAFFLPSAFAFFGFRFVLPKMISLGYPKVLMWGVIASSMLLIFTIIGFFLIKKEAKALDISIGERLLIKKISIKQWLICLGIMIVGIILSVVASPTVDFFKALPGLSIPDYMPFWLNPSIDPMNTDMDLLSPNYPLKGNYVLLIIMSIALLLNILAEEIYFRSWLLPKMQNLGKWSWVVNGLLFALYHTFQLWLFPMLIILSLATALTVYLSKSILPAFVTHIVANFLLSVASIIALVVG